MPFSRSERCVRECAQACLRRMHDVLLSAGISACMQETVRMMACVGVI